MQSKARSHAEFLTLSRRSRRVFTGDELQVEHVGYSEVLVGL